MSQNNGPERPTTSPPNDLTLDLSPLYWQDLSIGIADTTPARTITEADLVAFAGLSGDYNQIHTDAVFAAERGLGGRRIVHGLLGLSIATGLFGRSMLGLRMQPNVIALLNVDWKFVAPVHVDDTVHVDSSVVDRRETSDARRGIVAIQRELINQEGVTAQQGTFQLMIRCREGVA